MFYGSLESYDRFRPIRQQNSWARPYGTTASFIRKPSPFYRTTIRLASDSKTVLLVTWFRAFFYYWLLHNFYSTVICTFVIVTLVLYSKVWKENFQGDSYNDYSFCMKYSQINNRKQNESFFFRTRNTVKQPAFPGYSLFQWNTRVSPNQTR